MKWNGLEWNGMKWNEWNQVKCLKLYNMKWNEWKGQQKHNDVTVKIVKFKDCLSSKTFNWKHTCCFAKTQPTLIFIIWFLHTLALIRWHEPLKGVSCWPSLFNLLHSQVYHLAN